jgi:hypothetical protein
MKLTQANIARLALPADKSELLVFDETLPGFGIRLRAGGKRTWIAQYRTAVGQRRVTLGRVDLLHPDEARKRAKDMLAQVTLGDDPQADRKAEHARALVKFGNVRDQYLARVMPDLRPRSYEEVARHLHGGRERMGWSSFEDRPIHQITLAEVASRLNGIAVESGPVAANRHRATLSAMFEWARHCRGERSSAHRTSK